MIACDVSPVAMFFSHKILFVFLTIAFLRLNQQIDELNIALNNFHFDMINRCDQTDQIDNIDQTNHLQF